jgi:hypothetical protein
MISASLVEKMFGLDDRLAQVGFLLNAQAENRLACVHWEQPALGGVPFPKV